MNGCTLYPSFVPRHEASSAHRLCKAYVFLGWGTRPADRITTGLVPSSGPLAVPPPGSLRRDYPVMRFLPVSLAMMGFSASALFPVKFWRPPVTKYLYVEYTLWSVWSWTAGSAGRARTITLSLMVLTACLIGIDDANLDLSSTVTRHVALILN